MPSFGVAADQTTWPYRESVDCSGNLPAGFLNFCRAGGVRFNGTEHRDSDLRSVSGGLYQDKFTDNYVVGSLSGMGSNTGYVVNQFSMEASYVCFYTQANYQGRYWRTGKTGLRVVYPGSNGLMSMKSC